MTNRKKYENKLFIDMPFGEALERFAGVDPQELQANLDKGKKKKPPGRKKSQPGGPSVNIVQLRDVRRRKLNNV